jgi:hypothetical protein
VSCQGRRLEAIADVDVQLIEGKESWADRYGENEKYDGEQPEHGETPPTKSRPGPTPAAFVVRWAAIDRWGQDGGGGHRRLPSVQ